jgi:hypothetical protein
MGTYDIKCDICKKKIGETDNVERSYQGGLCPHCRFAGTQEKSLFQAISDKDNKLIREIERKAKSGTMVRIM